MPLPLMPHATGAAAGRACSHAARAPGGRIAATLLALLVTLLQACGGTTGDAEPPPPGDKLPELSGRVTNGATETNVALLQVTVKGNVGTARTAEGRLAPVDGSDYLASLDQLSGPYLLSDSAASSSFGLYAVATGPGTANLTPLTTLLVAELLGAEPGAFFAALGMRGGFTAADDATIAAAEQRVRRYLRREHGFEVPAGVGPFVTTPFSRTPGDPMYDTIRALVAQVGVAGDYSAVVTAVAQESARCRIERVSVAAATATDDFCPFAKSNAADPDDATVRVLGFSNRRGDVLTVRLRGAVVLGVSLATAEGATSACSEAGCTGVSVGTPAGDLTQDIGLAGTPLHGAGGTVTLTGSLRSAVPGIELPGLPCSDNLYYLIDEAAGAAQGYCATPDDFGLGASGLSLPSGATRRTYTFNDGAGGPFIEVVAQGSSVVRALVYATDPDTGAATAQFQCRDAGCAGVTLGTSAIDESLGVPIVLQPIRFDRAVLAAVLPDGSLSTTLSVTVEARFTGLYINDPNALPLLPVACSATAATILASPSDQPDPVAVCEPDDTQGFQLRSTSLDGDGNLVLSLAGLLSDGAGNFVAGNTVIVTMTPDGAIVSASFDAFDGPRYRCAAEACTGISVSAPDGAGERSVALAGATLVEQGTAGLAADRTVGLTGTFVAPAGP